MDSPWTAALAGLAAGAINGALARAALKKALARTDSVFYGVFAAGVLYRVFFLAAAVWLLRRENYIIIVPFAASLILSQLTFAVVPLKKHGTERDS